MNHTLIQLHKRKHLPAGLIFQHVYPAFTDIVCLLVCSVCEFRFNFFRFYFKIM